MTTHKTTPDSEIKIKEKSNSQSNPLENYDMDKTINSYKRTYYAMLRTSAIFAGLSMLLIKTKAYKANIFILSTIIVLTIINSLYHYRIIKEKHHEFKFDILYSLVLILILATLIVINYKFSKNSFLKRIL